MKTRKDMIKPGEDTFKIYHHLGIGDEALYRDYITTLPAIFRVGATVSPALSPAHGTCFGHRTIPAPTSRS